MLGPAEDDLDLDGGWVHVVRQVKLVHSRLMALAAYLGHSDPRVHPARLHPPDAGQ